MALTSQVFFGLSILNKHGAPESRVISIDLANGSLLNSSLGSLKKALLLKNIVGIEVDSKSPTGVTIVFDQNRPYAPAGWLFPVSPNSCLCVCLDMWRRPRVQKTEKS
jgi:hypothetical protein